jgi:hypothetical protein
MLDATYHPLQSTAFSQNWSNTGQITMNDDWSGVPSVIGFRGDGLTTSDGVDPRTVVAPSAVVDVNANQLNPDGFVTGGVTEFQITDPVVALQGSTTADAPYLQFHIDSRSVSDVRVSYLLRDIDGSADNAMQPVALQYRIGDTGDFIDVPGGFVADATNGPNLATLTTPVSVTLPAAAGNQEFLQVRVITTNAVGTDEWVGVDNILIENASGAAGSLGFEFANVNVSESVGLATVRVVRTGGTLGDVTINYATVAGGSATPDLDYAPRSGTLTFADGDVLEQFTIPILNDADLESNETINLQLTMAGGGATIGQGTGTVTILDNDALPPSGLLLNELDVNPPGDDGPFEYVELRGPAGLSLVNIYFVSLEGDGVDAGTADLVVDLSAASLGSNGLLMLKAPLGGFSPGDANTTVVSVTPFGNTSGGLENGSNSFALVFSTTPIVSGSDLDTDNNGFLELPSGSMMVDAVGWTDGGGTDVVYGAPLTQPTNPPAAATRRPISDAPMVSSAWYNGALASAGVPSTVTYNSANASSNLPPGALLTPGSANFPFDTVRPTVELVDFVFDAFPTRQTILLDFSENVQASLSVADDITLFNSTSSALIPSADIALNYDTGTDIARLTFPNYPNGILPDGNYSFILAAGSVQDLFGNPLLNATNYGFFAFGGDANRDRTVNIGDFSTLAARFNQPGTFSQGDFNYDGHTAIADFSLLASKFNTSLPAPRLPVAPTSTGPTEVNPDWSRRVVELAELD